MSSETRRRAVTSRAVAHWTLGAVAGPWLAMRSAPAGETRILAYHGVDDAERFRAQMRYVADRFQVTGAGEPPALVEGGSGRRVWLTFDDGDPSVVELGAPILAELGLTATMFVCPGVIDTSEPYWWQIVEMAADAGLSVGGRRVVRGEVTRLKRLPDEERRAQVALVREALEEKGHTASRPQLTSAQLARWLKHGHQLGNHTWDHPLLHTVSDREAERQIHRAHRWLSDFTGSDPLLFAYPNGDHSVASERLLRELGYDVGLLFDHKVHVGPLSLRMSRIRVDSLDPLPEFRSRASGLHGRVLSRMGRG